MKTLTPESEPPFVVHLTRMAGGLTLLGGIAMLVAADPAVGVAVVLLSALYFALAEIINYLAIIARKWEGDHRFLADEGSERSNGAEKRGSDLHI